MTDTLARLRDTARLLVTRFGPARPQEQEAQQFWTRGAGDGWRNNSHWRDGSQFHGTGLWEAVGREHIELYQRLRQASAVKPAPVERAVDWGCGGGANAVAFAGLASEIVGVDVAVDSVKECARQVANAGTTPFTPVVANVSRPELAAATIARPVSLFLCLYVLELVPDKEYGLRLMRIAYDLLCEGGQAFVQIKYSTGSWRTSSRRRGYRRDLAGVTYRIDEFWTAMQQIGFRPEAVSLVPANDLDERYAYFLLTR